MSPVPHEFSDQHVRSEEFGVEVGDGDYDASPYRL